MNIHILSLSLLSAPVLADNIPDVSAFYRPVQVSFDDIVGGDNKNVQKSSGKLLDSLKDVGMISVVNMPESFRHAKKETLAWTYPCAMDSGATKDHVFPDGSKRSTMATHTVPGPQGAVAESIQHDAPNSKACESFGHASLQFREMVDLVTKSFAGLVDELLLDTTTTTNGSSLLKTQDGFEFKTVREVVENGEHLEHFHSYQSQTAQRTRGDSLRNNKNDKDSTETIEWHTDQGMFLVFTPGVMVQQHNTEGGFSYQRESEGFYIELADGSRVQVQFGHEDDLVIMLGDGVNQYVNPALGGENSEHNHKLRAVPHALTMPSHASNTARVWYGRMVLPPASAVHPQHGKTFGELREILIDASLSPQEKDSEDLLSLGCSSPSMRALQAETSSCEEGTLLCWHRCMPLSQYNVSEEICGDEGLDLRCINPRSQLWDNTHGDWFPGCIDASTAEVGTDFPKLPDYPRDNETCTDVSYESFVETNAESYDHKADLMEGGVLMWSVEGDHINGMLSYNGLFGWVGLGFSGLPSGHGHPMAGAIIIFATPSDVYSPVTGFDFSAGEANVNEYIIDESTENKAFRHWMTPLTSQARAMGTIGNLDSYAVDETDCFTTMSFNTSGIYNTTFNISGSDELIWAANGVDMFAGYHGMSRGQITVEWMTGKVTLDATREALKNEQVEDTENGGSDADNQGATDASSSFFAFDLKATFFFMVNLVLVVLY